MGRNMPRRYYACVTSDKIYIRWMRIFCAICVSPSLIPKNTRPLLVAVCRKAPNPLMRETHAVYYSSAAVPPASVNFFASSSASSFTIPFATVFGAPSTNSFDCENKARQPKRISAWHSAAMPAGVGGKADLFEAKRSRRPHHLDQRDLFGFVEPARENTRTDSLD